METTQLLIRLLLSFIVLLTLTRMMGRKEISQMTFFNFVSAISIGTIGGSLITDRSLTIFNGVLALVGWSLFTVIMGWVDIKSRPARKFITGEPIVLIKNGVLNEKALRKTRLDLDSLRVLLRREKVFSVSDVDYAIFETNGKLSVLKKINKQPAAKEDIQTSLSPEPTPPPPPLDTAIISDGKVLLDNLDLFNLDVNWLKQQLNSHNIESPKQVFYAELEGNGNLYISKKA
ncbi:DUF421 domain-containing protein [Halobacillus salinarum]|uniref:DUF421 domain-containing protein n=1 Tax=Halobacillus salinarum TaxID=2932257 RepID=A0ABY4EP46_9BACI|nr:DUF421 domain-containing protein [Halobacillus salinarum]UOQ45755.1 DUF421 domain-containing protein [Halobacillus salinarum]